MIETAINDFPDVYSFLRERHEYRIDGKLVVSVTQALRRAGLVRFFCSRREVLEKARQRGTEVHMACADFDKGGPDYWSIGEHVGYVRAWQRFCSEWDFQPDLVETQVFNPTYRYAGTLDATGWIFHSSPSRQRYVIIDRKTGGYSAWHGEQLAGYQLALGSKPLAARMGVYLRKDGGYTTRMFENPADGASFLSALYVARTRTERGLCHDDEIFDRIIAGQATTKEESAAFSAIDWLNALEIAK